ncbi:hypothetical protein [Streptomyces sp. NBC_00878]|nr:hypothetical protein [Streptomyces sp. NBC_00878]MCX4911894.1 hypothetical protein [Streptomyces sp. NBC_00878]
MTMQMPDTRPPKPPYQGLFQEPDWPADEDQDGDDGDDGVLRP